MCHDVNGHRKSKPEYRAKGKVVSFSAVLFFSGYYFVVGVMKHINVVMLRCVKLVPDI